MMHSDWIQLSILVVHFFTLIAFCWVGFYKVENASRQIKDAIKEAAHIANKEGVNNGVKIRDIFRETFNREDYEGRFVYTGWKIPTEKDEGYLLEIRENVGAGIIIYSQTFISALNPKSFRFDSNRILMIPKDLIPVKFEVVVSCCYIEYPITANSMSSVTREYPKIYSRK